MTEEMILKNSREAISYSRAYHYVLEVMELAGTLQTDSYKVEPYDVVINNSDFVSTWRLDIGGTRIGLYLNPQDKTILVNTFGEDIEKVKPLLTKDIISRCFHALQVGMSYGDVHQVRGRKLTLWNFHNYKVFLKD